MENIPREEQSYLEIYAKLDVTKKLRLKRSFGRIELTQNVHKDDKNEQEKSDSDKNTQQVNLNNKNTQQVNLNNQNTQQVNLNNKNTQQVNLNNKNTQEMNIEQEVNVTQNQTESFETLQNNESPQNRTKSSFVRPTLNFTDYCATSDDIDFVYRFLSRNPSFNKKYGHLAVDLYEIVLDRILKEWRFLQLRLVFDFYSLNLDSEQSIVQLGALRHGQSFEDDCCDSSTEDCEIEDEFGIGEWYGKEKFNCVDEGDLQGRFGTVNNVHNLRDTNQGDLQGKDSTMNHERALSGTNRGEGNSVDNTLHKKDCPLDQNTINDPADSNNILKKNNLLTECNQDSQSSTNLSSTNFSSTNFSSTNFSSTNFSSTDFSSSNFSSSDFSSTDLCPISSGSRLATQKDFELMKGENLEITQHGSEQAAIRGERWAGKKRNKNNKKRGLRKGKGRNVSEVEGKLAEVNSMPSQQCCVDSKNQEQFGSDSQNGITSIISPLSSNISDQGLGSITDPSSTKCYQNSSTKTGTSTLRINHNYSSQTVLPTTKSYQNSSTKTDTSTLRCDHNSFTAFNQFPTRSNSMLKSYLHDVNHIITQIPIIFFQELKLTNHEISSLVNDILEIDAQLPQSHIVMHTKQNTFRFGKLKRADLFSKTNADPFLFNFKVPLNVLWMFLDQREVEKSYIHSRSRIKSLRMCIQMRDGSLNGVHSDSAPLCEVANERVSEKGIVEQSAPNTFSSLTNSNSSIGKPSLNASSSLTNSNSSIGKPSLNASSKITNSNSSIGKPSLNASSEITNINSSIGKPSLNTCSKITNGNSNIKKPSPNDPFGFTKSNSSVQGDKEILLNSKGFGEQLTVNTYSGITNSNLNIRTDKEIINQIALTQEMPDESTLLNKTRDSNSSNELHPQYLKEFGSIISTTLPTCNICTYPETSFNNLIITCNGCLTHYHQECYGVPNIDKYFNVTNLKKQFFFIHKLWFCRKCVWFSGISPKCKYCPISGNAFKQVYKAKRWGHIICAKFIKSLGLSNLTFMEPIEEYVDDKKEKKALGLTAQDAPMLKAHTRPWNQHFINESLGIARKSSRKKVGSRIKSNVKETCNSSFNAGISLREYEKRANASFEGYNKNKKSCGVIDQKRDIQTCLEPQKNVQTCLEPQKDNKTCLEPQKNVQRNLKHGKDPRTGVDEFSQKKNIHVSNVHKSINSVNGQFESSSPPTEMNSSSYGINEDRNTLLNIRTEENILQTEKLQNNHNEETPSNNFNSKATTTDSQSECILQSEFELQSECKIQSKFELKRKCESKSIHELGSSLGYIDSLGNSQSKVTVQHSKSSPNHYSNAKKQLSMLKHLNPKGNKTTKNIAFNSDSEKLFSLNDNSHKNESQQIDTKNDVYSSINEQNNTFEYNNTRKNDLQPNETPINFCESINTQPHNSGHDNKQSQNTNHNLKQSQNTNHNNTQSNNNNTQSNNNNTQSNNNNTQAHYTDCKLLPIPEDNKAFVRYIPEKIKSPIKPTNSYLQNDGNTNQPFKKYLNSSFRVSLDHLFKSNTTNNTSKLFGRFTHRALDMRIDKKKSHPLLENQKRLNKNKMNLNQGSVNGEIHSENSDQELSNNKIHSENSDQGSMNRGNTQNHTLSGTNEHNVKFFNNETTPFNKQKSNTNSLHNQKIINNNPATKEKTVESFMCHICKVWVGRTTNCCYSHCNHKYHVTCGINENYYFDTENNTTYCKKHDPRKNTFDKCISKQGSYILENLINTTTRFSKYQPTQKKVLVRKKEQLKTSRISFFLKVKNLRPRVNYFMINRIISNDFCRFESEISNFVEQIAFFFNITANKFYETNGFLNMMQQDWLQWDRKRGNLCVKRYHEKVFLANNFWKNSFGVVFTDNPREIKEFGCYFRALRRVIEEKSFDDLVSDEKACLNEIDENFRKEMNLKNEMVHENRIHNQKMFNPGNIPHHENIFHYKEESHNENISHHEDIPHNENIFHNENISHHEDIPYNENISHHEDIPYNENIPRHEDIPHNENISHHKIEPHNENISHHKIEPHNENIPQSEGILMNNSNGNQGENMKFNLNMPEVSFNTLQKDNSPFTNQVGSFHRRKPKSFLNYLNRLFSEEFEKEKFIFKKKNINFTNEKFKQNHMEKKTRNDMEKETRNDMEKETRNATNDAINKNISCFFSKNSNSVIHIDQGNHKNIQSTNHSSQHSVELKSIENRAKKSNTISKLKNKDQFNSCSTLNCAKLLQYHRKNDIYHSPLHNDISDQLTFCESFNLSANSSDTNSNSILSYIQSKIYNHLFNYFISFPNQSISFPNKLITNLDLENFSKNYDLNKETNHKSTLFTLKSFKEFPHFCENEKDFSKLEIDLSQNTSKKYRKLRKKSKNDENDRENSSSDPNNLDFCKLQGITTAKNLPCHNKHIKHLDIAQIEEISVIYTTLKKIISLIHSKITYKIQLLELKKEFNSINENYQVFYQEKIIEKLLSTREFQIFKEPVTEDIAPKYFTIIKNPMCLDNILCKIRTEEYSFESLFKDLRQIAENCRVYNSGVSYYINIANKFNTAVERIYEEMK